jgi:organic hydroperoxide reductase OsmC/OhrA
MATYKVQVTWERGRDESFLDGTYSRGHTWVFDGGLQVPASSSPHIVPIPYSVESNVDPEEAFVAALSSCHMLFFLSIAARNGYIVDRYEDKSSGGMGKGDNGRICMTSVTIRPEVAISSNPRPSRQDIETMHHEAHEQCFIANSVNTIVVVEPELKGY